MRSDKLNIENKSPPRSDLIISVGAEKFMKEVIEETRPVLLLCMYRDSEFQAQRGIIEGICRRFGKKLKACLIDEEFIGAFKKKFDVKGTPTILIFVKGAEEGRLLGQAEQQPLEDFLLRTLPRD